MPKCLQTSLVSLTTTQTAHEVVSALSIFSLLYIYDTVKARESLGVYVVCYMNTDMFSGL